MSKKAVILVENDLFKLEDMLLSIQSILFVAARQNLSNAPGKGDTTICVLHLLGSDEDADAKTFGRLASILEARQRELMTSECELDYKYETVHIDRESYPPKDWDEGMEIVCEKISEISRECDYSIVLDMILDNKKDPNIILNKGKILSQFLYQKYSGHCVPYTTYANSEQKYRTAWADGVEPEKVPYERFCLDGNSIRKDVKSEIYGHLKIGI